MAVKDLNAKGGLLGKQLKLLVGDDACDPKQAVTVAAATTVTAVRLFPRVGSVSPVGSGAAQPAG